MNGLLGRVALGLLLVGCGGVATDDEGVSGGTAGEDLEGVGGEVNAAGGSITGSAGGQGGSNGGLGGACAANTSNGYGGAVHFDPTSPPENSRCALEGLSVCGTADTVDRGEGYYPIGVISHCENGVWVRGETQVCEGECNVPGAAQGVCCDVAISCQQPFLGYCDGYQWRAQ